MQHLLILWKSLQVEDTCHAKQQDKVKMDNISQSSTFKKFDIVGWFLQFLQEIISSPRRAKHMGIFTWNFS